MRYASVAIESLLGSTAFRLVRDVRVTGGAAGGILGSA